MKKLLLRRDVPKLGHVGDVVEVNDGYARNYLLPHHLAMEPTQANLKAIEEEKQKAAAVRMEHRKALEKRADSLEGVEVTIAAAANEEGHLYGSVGPREISAALRDEGHQVDTSEIQLHDPIRQLDSVMVPIVLADDLRTEVKVWVVREKASGDLDVDEAEQDKDDEASDTEDDYGRDESEQDDEFES